MSVETTEEVLTHQVVRIREALYRIKDKEDVVTALRVILSHCMEHQLPFDDCMGAAVTAPLLRPAFKIGDLKEGDVFVSAYGAGVSERRVTKPTPWSTGVMSLPTGNSRTPRRYVSYAEVVYIGTRKEYDRLLRRQKLRSR